MGSTTARKGFFRKGASLLGDGSWERQYRSVAPGAAKWPPRLLPRCLQHERAGNDVGTSAPPEQEAAGTEVAGTPAPLTDGFHLLVDPLKLNEVKTIWVLGSWSLTWLGWRRSQVSGTSGPPRVERRPHGCGHRLS